VTGDRDRGGAARFRRGQRSGGHRRESELHRFVRLNWTIVTSLARANSPGSVNARARL